MKLILRFISWLKNIFLTKDKKELLYKYRLLNTTLDSFPFESLGKELSELNWQWSNPETGDVACPSINQLIEFTKENLLTVYSECQLNKNTIIKKLDGFVFIATWNDLTKKVKDLQIIFDKSTWYQN